MFEKFWSVFPFGFLRYTLYRARICKRLWRPGIDFDESIPPGWESIPGLLKSSTNTGSVQLTRTCRTVSLGPNLYDLGYGSVGPKKKI
jgi:hypothetical protein